MKTVNKAILNSAICAGVSLLGALAVYVAFFHMLPQPLLKEQSIEVRTKIQEINDIEHLRKVALLLEASRRSDIKSFNEVFKSAVVAMAWLFIMAGVMLLSNITYWLRFLREQRNEHVPWWLRWL